MSDDSLTYAENFPINDSSDFTSVQSENKDGEPPIPAYLEETYWWAYLHPRAIWVFEREWLVNLILWGNMRRLTQSVLDELDCAKDSSVLQLACVYGDFSHRVAGHLQTSDSQLHILDIAPIQLHNAKTKLDQHDNVSLHHQDASALSFKSERYDHTVVFFLLHEQPEEVRRKTIAEALRVTRPGGKVVFVDYHQPSRLNPLRYLMRPILSWLEPFALDLWRTPLPDYLPESVQAHQVDSQFYCSGLYQKVVINC